MRRAVLALLAAATLAACTPAPRNDDPLTPLRGPAPTNPLVLPPAQDPNGGAE